MYWDISWHMTIGRDTFWTPAHLLIQSGGMIAGLTSGFVVLKSTIAPNERDIATGVRVWGFRGPLGAWLCIWGCFAMVASAPFDNWWHDAYGLDVKIVSPPHTILALGIYAIVNGALMLTLAAQNRSEGRDRDRFAILYVVAGGMTMAAAVYMGLMLALMWGIQLVKATPKLGPIYQPITHMVAMAWPLWLIVPAYAIDRVRHWIGGRKVPMPIEAAALGLAFSAPFFVVQWLWSWFMVRGTWSRNWFFNSDNFVYWAAPSYVERTHQFAPDGSTFGRAALVTLGIASVSSLVGLAWGSWMSRVRR